jgi:hypothetical protein
LSVSAETLRVIGGRLLRSLDAIHLATAHELRAELTAFVCYDKRLGDSAQALGLPVEAPALPDGRRRAGHYGAMPRDGLPHPADPTVTVSSERPPGIRGFSGECAFAVLPGEAFAHSPCKSLGESAFTS